MSDIRYRSFPLLGASGTPAKQIDLNSLSVQAHFCPIVKTHITTFALIIMNDIGAAGIALLKYRPTAGSASGEVTVATINLDTPHTQGKVVYKAGLDHDGSPGGEYIVEVTNVCAAGDLASAMMWGYESYEEPGNFTAYVATA